MLGKTVLVNMIFRIPEMLTVESYPQAGAWVIEHVSTRGGAYDHAAPSIRSSVRYSAKLVQPVSA